MGACRWPDPGRARGQLLPNGRPYSASFERFDSRSLLDDGSRVSTGTLGGAAVPADALGAG
jgi:hypothetical protein